MQMKTQDEEGIKQSEDFYKMGNYEDKIYSLNGTVTALSQTSIRRISRIIRDSSTLTM